MHTCCLCLLLRMYACLLLRMYAFLLN
jgi:hypothetical protein